MLDKKNYSAIHSIRGGVRPAFQLATVLINDAVTCEAITRKQERTFLDFIKNDTHYSKYYDGMYILFKTGMRISEFTGLTVKDLDMENRTINIDYQLQKTGTAPLHMDSMEVKNMLLGYKEDEYGNVLGGVRLPELEVPAARYFANTLITGLIGYKIPFTEAELKELYPTHQDYVDKVTAAAIAAKEAGIILPYRAEEYIREAEAAPIPAADVPEMSN